MTLPTSPLHALGVAELSSLLACLGNEEIVWTEINYGPFSVIQSCLQH